MSEATERATAGLTRIHQIHGETVTVRHEKAATTESITVAFVTTGQGDETAQANVVVETGDLSTAMLLGDGIVRADGSFWFVAEVFPLIGTVQRLGVVIHQE